MELLEPRTSRGGQESDQRAGAAHLWRQAEGAGLVRLGEEVLRRPHCTFPVPKWNQQES